MPSIKSLPQHIGIILDGNRRWARERGLPTLAGHREGALNFKSVALAAFDRGVSYVSAFVFSTENWSRTKEEVSYLMKLVAQATKDYLEEFNQAGVKIVILGRREDLKPSILKLLKRAETETADNQRGVLALCFNYGGREEIVDGVKKLISEGIQPSAVTAESIRQSLYEPDIPDIDLLIRTGGEQRTSGYMMWRADYAELYFTDKHWPDFSVADFEDALAEYARRQRRFGS